MKIYTNTFDLAKASPHRFWVAPYSDFKIGVKILAKGEVVDKDFTVKAGSTEFTPDADKIDNFTLFTIKSNDTGFVEYTIEVEGVAEKLKLMQIVTDSTVFEIDAGGGGDVPADVATQTWVNSQISDFITEDALDGYATESYVDSATSSFVEEGELTAYATKAELTAYAETSDLTAYAQTTDLTAFYTKSETSSATEISTALEGKQPTGDYALTSQIPTVNDASVTLTQDGTTVGSFTLNQSNDISVDFAGGSGGGAISAYAVSDSPIQSETLIRQALVDNTCLPQTIALNQDGTIEIFDVEGKLNLHQESPSFISLIPNAVKVLVGTKVTNLGARCFWGANKCKDIVLPNSLSGIIAGEFTGEVFSGIPANRITIPDSVTTFGNGSIFWNWQSSGSGVVDFGNTRMTIPTGGNFTTNSPTVKYIVPDSLYSQWITTGSWANVSAQVFPHSQMPGAVKSTAYAGTVGTPAAISNMQTVYETDWATLSASALSSVLYVVVPDPE